MIGEATKLTPYLVELDKEYLATVRLGVSTDTQDLSGTVLESRPVPELDAASIGKALTPFLLDRIQALTGGRSLATNIALVKHNAEVGARLALALASLSHR